MTVGGWGAFLCSRGRLVKSTQKKKGPVKGEEMYPSNYRYTKQHEWIDVKGDTGTVGITDYAQHELGDVVFVELPKVGAKLTAGKALGTVESVKAVSEIYSPVSGEVAEVNGSLGDSPEKINTDPHGAAWLVKLKLSNPGELSGLMDAAGYESFIASQESHS
jgi:glycine cleavage system H protein